MPPRFVDTAQAIGARVRSRRMELGLSQESVGIALGVSQMQVAKYERGENQIGLDRVEALCEVLQVDMGALFGMQIDGLSPWASDMARKLDALPSHQRNAVAFLIDTLTKDAKGYA